jgi:hypothetical protein
MKLQLTTYGKKFTVETDFDDISLDEYFEIFKGLLVQATFSEDSINDFIIKYANELIIIKVSNELKDA